MLNEVICPRRSITTKASATLSRTDRSKASRRRSYKVDALRFPEIASTRRYAYHGVRTSRICRVNRHISNSAQKIPKFLVYPRGNRQKMTYSHPPPEAMRPLAPRAYHGGSQERLGWVRHLPTRQRAILRDLTDRPLRTVLTVAGIARAVPITLSRSSGVTPSTFMIDVQFAAAERSDRVVDFTTAPPGGARNEITHPLGVLVTKPGARFRFGSARVSAAIGQRSPDCP